MARRRTRSIRGRGSLLRKGILSVSVNIIARSLPFVLTALIIAIVAGMVVSFISNLDYFKLKNIRIVGEKTEAGTTDILPSLNLKKGISIFSVKLKECESAINHKHPEFRDLKVRRIMPDTLQISYILRKPFCQIDSGRFYLASDDAVIFSSPSMISRPDLPIITGIDVSEGYSKTDRHYNSKPLKRAISLIKEVDEGGLSNMLKIARIDVSDPQNPSILLEDQTVIEIGEYSFKEKQKVLQEVLYDLEAKNKKAKVIDLRFKDVVVVPR